MSPQMASISVAQHLYDEAEGHVLKGMKLAVWQCEKV